MMHYVLFMLNCSALIFGFNFTAIAGKKPKTNLQSLKNSNEALNRHLDALIASVDQSENDIIQDALKNLNRSLKNYQKISPGFKEQLKLSTSLETSVTESSCHVDMSHCPEPVALKESIEKASYCCAEDSSGGLQCCIDTWGRERSYKPQKALSCLFCFPCVAVLLGGAAIASCIFPCLAWKKTGAIIVWEPWDVDKPTLKAALTAIKQILAQEAQELVELNRRIQEANPNPVLSSATPQTAPSTQKFPPNYDDIEN